MAEQYLTLANETDQAFQMLVDYFSQQEEPTIILMFGDHQPRWSRSSWTGPMGCGRRT